MHTIYYEHRHNTVTIKHIHIMLPIRLHNQPLRSQTKQTNTKPRCGQSPKRIISASHIPDAPESGMQTIGERVVIIVAYHKPPAPCCHCDLHYIRAYRHYMCINTIICQTMYAYTHTHRYTPTHQHFPYIDNTLCSLCWRSVCETNGA